MSQQANQPITADSPFNLDNNAAYRQWRADKLQYSRPVLDDLLVQILDPYQLANDEKSSIIQRCEKYNMAVYQLNDPEIKDKSLVHELGKQLALKRLDANLRADEDSVSSLEVREQAGNKYIPYTNKHNVQITIGNFLALSLSI